MNPWACACCGHLPADHERRHAPAELGRCWGRPDDRRRWWSRPRCWCPDYTPQAAVTREELVAFLQGRRRDALRALRASTEAGADYWRWQGHAELSRQVLELLAAEVPHRPVTAPNAGEQLDAIMRDLDATGAAWVAAGYPSEGPEYDAREAVFARLHEWNAEQDRRAGRG